MKTDIKLLDIKKVKTPNFNEPKGDLYIKAMQEIYLKVEEKRSIKNNSINNITSLKTKLNKLKNQLLMAEDKFEEVEYRKQIKQLKDDLENISDYSGLNIEEFAKKLISNDKIEQLQEEAKEEFLEILGVATIYKEELDKEYTRATREVNRFIAGYNSDSSFRKANVKYNDYKN